MHLLTLSERREKLKFLDSKMTIATHYKITENDSFHSNRASEPNTMVIYSRHRSILVIA